jgi:hypothetical protein
VDTPLLGKRLSPGNHFLDVARKEAKLTGCCYDDRLVYSGASARLDIVKANPLISELVVYYATHLVGARGSLNPYPWHRFVCERSNLRWPEFALAQSAQRCGKEANEHGG